MMKIADRLRRFALFVCATRENGGASQAVCIFLDEIAESLRLFAFWGPATHENGGASQAACTPMMKIAEILRLSEPAVTKMAGRLRRFACP